MKIIGMTAAASWGPLVMLLGVMLVGTCLAAAEPKLAGGWDIPVRGAAVTKPAPRWEEAFLSGNGRMGMMMFGRPHDEIIVVNHCRLYLPRGSREIVPDLGKLLPKMKVIGLKGGPGAVHNFLRAYPFIPGFQGDRHPVLIRSADGDHISSPLSEVSNINIRRDIYPGQVPQVNGSVGIGQCRGYQGSLEFFCSHCELIGKHKDSDKG